MDPDDVSWATVAGKELGQGLLVVPPQNVHAVRRVVLWVYVERKQVEATAPRQSARGPAERTGPAEELHEIERKT